MKTASHLCFFLFILLLVSCEAEKPNIKPEQAAFNSGLVQAGLLENGAATVQENPGLLESLRVFSGKESSFSNLEILPGKKFYLIGTITNKLESYDFAYPLIKKGIILFLDNGQNDAVIHKCKTNSVCSRCTFSKDADGNVDGCSCKAFVNQGSCNHTLLIIEDR